MTAVRWVVDFPQDQLGTGGWIEYPDERTARAHAGTAATVWALVTPGAVRLVERAEAYREAMARGSSTSKAYFDLMDAVDLAQQETR